MKSPNPILPPHRQFARLWLITHGISLSTVATEMGLSCSQLEAELARTGVPESVPLFRAMVKLSGLSQQAVRVSIWGMVDSAKSSN